MDALHFRKNAWDKSGMTFILTVIRGLELMWTIWSCCVTCCTSQANCIFSGFSCLNPSFKSRLPNIVLFLISFYCSLQLDWFPVIETGKVTKKKVFFVVHLCTLLCFLENWGKSFQCCLHMLSRKMLGVEHWAEEESIQPFHCLLSLSFCK